MDYIDYYKTLGLAKTATQDDIKKAYRRLARKMHPDLNPNDKEAGKKFQQLNEANEVLGNAENRKKYDRYGKDWQHADQFDQQRAQQGAGGGQSFGGNFGGADGGDFSSFFESMFGGGGGTGRQKRQTKYKGQDVKADLNLSLTDAMLTHPQTFTINGKSVRITIPAGVDNGQQIKLAGYGSPGVNGGPAGDLYITFNVADNAEFKRTGPNLYSNQNIDVFTAVLGGEVITNTLGGKVKLKVAPGTQPGTRIRVKGKGFPVYKQEGSFGDLYVTYQVTIPTTLTPQQEALFTELKNLG